MKKRTSGFIIILLLLATFTPACAQPEGGGNSATVLETVKQVEAHPRAEDDWRPATVGLTVYGGGQVRTGAESSARLELLEGIVRLWADTVFTVKECVTRQERLVTTLLLQEGRLWAHLTTGQPHQFTVETASAIATVRDTHFSVFVAANRVTLVSVAEGEVTLTAQGQSVTVSAGQQSTVEPGRPPTPPEPMSNEELALWATEGDMPEMAALISTPTATSTHTPTPTPTLTLTPVPPTETPTLSPTPVPPTETPTLTPTSVPPTETPTPIPTFTPTLAPPPGPENSAFISQDGQELAGTYYPPDTCSAPITVVYFPWVRGDRNDWNSVAAILPPEAPKVGSFSITARGCEGGCGDDWDRAGWQLDYTAALAAVQEIPCAEQSRLVAIGSSVGADGAIYACAQQEECVGALAFSPNGWLNVPYEEEVAAMVQQGKHVWTVVTEGDIGSARLNRPEWSQFYHEIVLPGQEHGNQLYTSATGQLIQDFLECAANSFTLPKCTTIPAGN